MDEPGQRGRGGGSNQLPDPERHGVCMCMYMCVEVLMTVLGDKGGREKDR